jgi:PAS domain S-box-containing protein
MDDPLTPMNDAVADVAQSLGNEYAAVFELLPGGTNTRFRAGAGWKAGLTGHAVAVLSVAAAVILTLWMRMNVGQSSTPIVALFLCAVMVTSWFGGARPGLLAFALSILAFKFYFVSPMYSWTVEIKEIPRLLVFALSAFFVGSLSVAQRRAAESISHARDDLDGIVQKLRRTNEALLAENAERKRAEEKLKRSESLLAEAQEIAHVGSWSWDICSGRLTWSDELYCIFGIERSTSPPTNDDFLAALHPGDRARMTELIDAACRGTASYDCDFRIIRPDGGVRVVYTRGKVIRNEAGEAIEMIGTGQDITERKQIEQTLKRSESLLTEAQQIAHIGSWNWDLRSGVLEWSNEHYRIFGIKPHTLPTTLDLAFTCIHPDDLADLKQAVTRSIESRQPYECSFRVLHGDRSVRVVQSRGQVAAEENGKPLRMCGTIQDITERAEAEEKLRRSESLLADAQQVAHIGSWSWDLLSDTLLWSDEHYRVFGLRPQEMPITYDRFLDLVHPDDRATVQNAVDQALREQQPLECSLRALHRDGAVRDVYARGRVVIDEAGKPVRMFGTIQDVTEAKRAEEALRGSEERVRLLLESTAEAIYGIDLEGNCTFSNPACLRLLGYSDAGDLLGKSMHELTHYTRPDGTQYPKEECRIFRAFLRGEEVHADDEVLWRADGTSFPAEYWCHPVRREGQIVGAVVTFMDIAERKRLEKEILEISERERRRIGQDLHDDLCQQLTGIAFTSRLLQQRLAARAVPEAGAAEKIVHAVQHATARARDLAKGLHPVRLEADGLAAALRELTATLESVFQVSCRFRCHAGRRSVRVDDPTIAIQLYRIAQESATNAVKHGKAKYICISISVVKGRMKLIIADDGVGIADAPNGHGMGLPVMHQRARMIGAALTISPRRKGGTLVTCSLDGRTIAPTAPAAKRRLAKPRLPRKTIGPTSREGRGSHGSNVE